MSLINERSNQGAAMLEKSFIQKVLREEGANIDQAMQQKMVGFSNATTSGRSFKVNDTTLTYTHKKRHRFIDMKTRNTKQGKIKKKNYVIHNRPIFGHLNNIIRRLSFGFTEAAKQELMKLDGQEM